MPAAGQDGIIEEEKVPSRARSLEVAFRQAAVVGHYIVMDGPVFVFLCSRFFAVVLVRGCNRLISFLLSYPVRIRRSRRGDPNELFGRINLGPWYDERKSRKLVSLQNPRRSLVVIFFPREDEVA